jgi:hypothetical protein
MQVKETAVGGLELELLALEFSGRRHDTGKALRGSDADEGVRFTEATSRVGRSS